MNKISRSSGILLHISSLPGDDGIGTIGRVAYRWVDFLNEAGIKYWQILPLNPTGYGNSPYQGLSAFAGNPLFIDLPELVREGLLTESDLKFPRFPLQKIDFQKVLAWKPSILRCAFDRFLSGKQNKLNQQYEQFVEANASWLQDFAVFMAMRETYKHISWSSWPDALRRREPEALRSFEKNNFKQIDYHKFLQFLFFWQWERLKSYANNKGIQLIGDIPIFMGFDCVDVWANPQLFQLDNNLEPFAVAGVPPDFFSDTGQLWGNPLYDWAAHQQDNYRWWTARVRETLKTVDLIRLDHFRGFAGYYRIPADSETAEKGEWIPGPGEEFFDRLLTQIGDLPFIAEDLGVITADVIALREKYGFPGMRLLQFAFWKNGDHEFLPHNYPDNCVVYTGTHDNDTTVGWFKKAPQHERNFCASYLGGHTADIAHEMIRTIWRTNARLAIAPMQDFLRLGGWARMNLPSTTAGNWSWRMKPNALTPRLVKWIKKINITFNRALEAKEWEAGEYFNK
ncbi:4-alpha-glucanotransferase [candidate division KSB1 bacterium]|nr:4-alpha-glucanotransferase [candidate division KSB1 bacterium]